MFLNIRIDRIMLKTYDQQFTVTTKKSLHIIFNDNKCIDYIGLVAGGHPARKNLRTNLKGLISGDLTYHRTTV